MSSHSPDAVTRMTRENKQWSLPIQKPGRLGKGDRVAVVSPCWGGPSVFPHRYRAGKEYLERAFGLEVIEMPNALRDALWLDQNPKARADDLHQAFSDPRINAVVASIGGDDAIRLIPHLDISVLAANPKIFLGYSDVTTLHFACLRAGFGSFYGPTIMAGIGENCGMHAFSESSLRRTIFEPNQIGAIPKNIEGWTVEHLDWADPANQSRCRKLKPCTGPRVLQGKGCVRGHLVGGCAETLEMLKGTDWWPPAEIWDDAILFYETSEEGPPPEAVLRWLRNFGAQGILSRVSGFLLGRPGGQIAIDSHARYEDVTQKALAEAGASDLPLMVDMDFGHTDPIMTLPYGAIAEIDCDKGELSIIEAAVI